ncbi:MAG: hypothetical protein GY701_11705 [Sulfitobacter sp.]|nr:hypothetical protein [Sulfitobacter sp.]
MVLLIPPCLPGIPISRPDTAPYRRIDDAGVGTARVRCAHTPLTYPPETGIIIGVREITVDRFPSLGLHCRRGTVDALGR